jgi:hypothetical protein
LIKGIVILSEAKNLWFDGCGSAAALTSRCEMFRFAQHDNDSLARFNAVTI